MATNLEVGKYNNSSASRLNVAPSLNFMFVPSSWNKHAVAKCCGQLGRLGKCREVRGGGGGRARGKCFLLFAAFCDSRKTLEKVAQPSPPCLKPSLHNRHSVHFFSCLFLPLVSRVSRLLASQNPSDHSLSWLAGVFVINVYLQEVSLVVIFVPWMKVGAVPSSAKLNILFY